REEKKVVDHKGQEYTYDYLVLATGSKPFVPPIPNVDSKGVFVYRTIEDLDAIRHYAQKIKKRKRQPQAAVLGGGLLGLEAANATKELGLQTDVVEFASRIMPRQLDEAASQMLQSTIEKMGIRVHVNKKATA